MRCYLFFVFAIHLSGQNCLQLAAVEWLIRNTFNGYDCINVYSGRGCKDEPCQIDSALIVQRIHELNFSVIVLSSLANGNEHCGYVLVGNNEENLRVFDDIVFEQILRALFLQLSSNDLAYIVEESAHSFRDKDVVLAALPASSTKPLKIYLKSRYEVEIRSMKTDPNVSEPFLHPKSDPPNTIDFHQQPIKVATFHCPIYNSIVNDELHDGVETRIYREIQRKLNFTTELIVPGDGKRWGTVYPNGTISGGLMKIFWYRKADLGFCSVWIENSKRLAMRFSAYWDLVCLQFLVPKPRVLPTRWYNVFTPLPNSIWIMVSIAFTITWATCSLFSYLEARFLRKILNGSYVVSELLTLTGILLHAKNPEPNHGTRVNRHLYMWWSVFALVVTSQYSTSLVSHLTYPNFEPMRGTVEDLVKNGYYWGTPYEILMSCVFKLDNPWHRKFVNSFVYETSLEDRLHHLSQGNYSILVHKVGDRHFMEVDTIPVDVLRELRTSRTCVTYFYLGFAYGKTFPLARQADSIIMRLVESGITKYWLNRIFEPKYPFTTFARVYEYKTPREEIELTPFNLGNLKGAFLIWMVGISLAWTALVGELLIDSLSKTQRGEAQRVEDASIVFLRARANVARRNYRRSKIKVKRSLVGCVFHQTRK